MKIELKYITNEGCEWLEETVTVNHKNYYEVIGSYFNRTKETAQKLVKKWAGNGENESLTLDVELVEINNPELDKGHTWPMVFKTVMEWEDEGEDEVWIDPAGGVHYGDEDDPAAMYI